jgi:hypothetical protein
MFCVVVIFNTFVLNWVTCFGCVCCLQHIRLSVSFILFKQIYIQMLIFGVCTPCSICKIIFHVFFAYVIIMSLYYNGTTAWGLGEG